MFSKLQESTSRLGAGVRGRCVVFVRLLSLLSQTASLCTGSDGKKNPAEKSLRHSGCSTLVGACRSFSICRAQNWQLLYIYAHTGIQEELLFEVMFLLFVYSTCGALVCGLETEQVMQQLQLFKILYLPVAGD